MKKKKFVIFFQQYIKQICDLMSIAMQALERNVKFIEISALNLHHSLAESVVITTHESRDRPGQRLQIVISDVRSE